MDGIPSEVRTAPFLASACGSFAVALSEYVIATMGAFARDLPGNRLRESSEHWHVQQARTLAGATVGLYGFGGRYLAGEPLVGVVGPDGY